MKDYIINNSLRRIKDAYPNYDEVKMEEIEYGLVSIYLLFSKLIVISALAILLGITKEFLTFLLIYNIVRLPSFGLHASKSYICLIASITIFIGIPIIASNIVINGLVRAIIGSVTIVLMCLYSPADTHKKPIINKTRRLTYKYLSVIIAIICTSISLAITNTFIQNCLIFALLIQTVIILPITYKIFKMPYNNYLKYVHE